MLWIKVCDAYRSQLPPGKSSPRCSRPQWTLLWRKGSLPGCCVVFYTAAWPRPPGTPHTLLPGRSLVCPLPATLVPAGSECGVGWSVPQCMRLETFWNMKQTCNLLTRRGNWKQIKESTCFFVSQLLANCVTQKILGLCNKNTRKWRNQTQTLEAEMVQFSNLKQTRSIGLT